MEIRQQKKLLKIDADYKNGKLDYKSRSLFFKIEKECMVCNMKLDEIHTSRYCIPGFLVFGILFLIFAAVVLVAALRGKNSFDNFLCWIIPCVICFVVFFLTKQSLISIPTEFGDFDFLYYEDDENFGELVNQLNEDFEKFTPLKSQKIFLNDFANLKSEFQKSGMTKKEFAKTKSEKFINYSCPICNKSNQINTIHVREVFSIFIATSVEKKYVTGCKKCLRREVGNANIYSAVLGLWSLPWGLIATPYSIILNLIKYKTLKEDKPSRDFEKCIMKEIK